MTITRRRDPAGLMGDHVAVELDGAQDDLESVIKLFAAASPTSRIEALRRIPALIPVADELAGRLEGPKKSADMRLMHDIAQAELRALYADAAPRVIRDNRRQDGTRTPRRPEVDAWIGGAIKRTPNATRDELWAAAPEWITDDIGLDRFKKRVSKVRAASK